MRIALVISLIQMGGMETVLKSLGKFFRGNGHDVEFVEAEAEGSWSAYFQTLGFPVRTLPLKWHRSKVAHSRMIASVLNRYDAILLNDVPYAQATLGLLDPGVISVPIIHLDLPSFISNAASNNGQWDRVVAVSPLLKERFLTTTGYDEESIAYIANGVDVPDAWPKSGQLTDASRPLAVAFSGRIENRQKGVFLLPDVLRALNETGTDIHLNVIGDGPDLQALRARFADSGIRNVTFHGALTHEGALSAVERNDALIMPSYFEGMPIALLESMARGVVPVVSNLRGSTDLIVRNGANGFLVDAGRTEGFIEGVRLMARDRIKLREMSRLAWETVSDGFNVVKMGTAYLALMEDISRKKRHGACPRSQRIDFSLLGDLPRLPHCLVRPARKLLKVLKMPNTRYL